MLPTDHDGEPDFLSISEQFQENVLPRIYPEMQRNSKHKEIFEVWKSHGGTVALCILNKNANISDEETFAELCFHSLITRLFATKWSIDHGLLEDTVAKNTWQKMSKSNQISDWEVLLKFSGDSEIEHVLRNIFKTSDMYMWIIDVLPESIRRQMIRAFEKQQLTSDETDILGCFYQSYINKYSRKAQFELGQFYTPYKLVRAMWTLVSQVVKEHNLSLNDPEVITIDPSAGTGTFLAQGLRYSLSGGWGDRRHQRSSKEISSASQRFCGLEINPFSKGVADVNLLTEILLHCRNVFGNEISPPAIFETNSYDFGTNSGGPSLFEESDEIVFWKKRYKEACKAKNSKYTIVIGNPPWRNPSPAMKSNSLKNTIKNDILPWGFEYDNESLGDIRGCNHGIREEYAYFFGVANKLVKSKGLICFVTNESWLTGPTYRLFRKYMLDHYSIKAIVRIGSYFKGVKEKACVALLESSDKAKRNQKIPVLDWSDASNSEWSYDWINKNIERLISGKVKDSEWSSINAYGENLSIHSNVNSSGSFGENYLYLEEIAVRILQGAQPGFSPLFYDEDRDNLTRKMLLLFSGTQKNIDKLSSELQERTRGGKEKATELLLRAKQSIVDFSARFEPEYIREVIAYVAGNRDDGGRRRLYCYFDPRIWLFPRVQRLHPSHECVWDATLKLIFRDFSDIGGTRKKICAFIEESNAIIDNHALNGGAQVISFESSHSAIRSEILKKIKMSEDEWMFFLFGVLNSQYAKEWAQTKERQRIQIPAHPEFIDKMKLISKISRENAVLIDKAFNGDLNDIETRKIELVNNKITDCIGDMKSISRNIDSESSFRRILKLAS